MENKLIVPQDVYNRIEADALAWSENQYGHDDVNKDYLEGALREAMIAQAEYVRLNAPTGPRWVKASKRLPKDENLYHLNFGTAKTNMKTTGFYDGEKWHRQDGAVLDWHPNLVWLDEQPAGREDDAVAFGEWLKTEVMGTEENTNDNIPLWIYRDENCYTTTELYELFKQQKEGK